MRNKLLLIFACLVNICVYSQWSPIKGRIQTEWAKDISINNVFPEYPRPIMERSEWMNLNGLWDYSIIDKGSHLPESYDGDILVPFAVESSLSGVGKSVGYKKELVYHRSFKLDSKWKGKNILLHFGAVDWKTDVWVNGIRVGSHIGGFTPFTFDITEALNIKGNNSIVVKVWDPTDKGYQPRGKQVSEPKGIWYTPVTGIWQTVWLEPVNSTYISDLRITPDIDSNILNVKAVTKGLDTGSLVSVRVFDCGKLVAEGSSINGGDVQVEMPENAKLWSPDSPFLYDINICLKKRGEVVDEAESYAAMRKFSSKRDNDGIVRLELNNKPLFQFGLLDQGWWPDGLYTAPTDEALVYDIKKTKDFGYNMIRKHIKVEPARWYSYCDKLGIIVWQDMPSGDRNPEWQNRKYFDGTEIKRSVESETSYRKEWKEIMDCLYSYPCIGTWVPFNEAWGQFKTPEIVEWTKQYDPSRLVNPASGGNHYACGDMLDLHNYPAPEMYLYDAQRANVLGEYGGIGWGIPGHTWETDRNWGYVRFNSSKEVTDEYVKYAEKLYELISRGFSGAVYTQTTDVEIEVNGLITYDRKIIKVDEKRIREINKKICNSLNK